MVLPAHLVNTVLQLFASGRGRRHFVGIYHFDDPIALNNHDLPPGSVGRPG